MGALEAVIDLDGGDLNPQEALAVTAYVSLLDLHEAAAEELDQIENDCVQAIVNWIGR